MITSFAELTQNHPHKPIIEEAVSALHNAKLPFIAIDCGCGAGNESAYLLQQGFKVYAFDSSEMSETICFKRFQDQHNFHFFKIEFEHFEFPQVSLIVALLSLFFCDSQHFYQVIQKITDALPSRGVFLVELLGQDDAWVKAQPEKFIGFNLQSMGELFAENYEYLSINEMKGNRLVSNGSVKFWHIYTLVLRKI